MSQATPQGNKEAARAVPCLGFGCNGADVLTVIPGLPKEDARAALHDLLITLAELSAAAADKAISHELLPAAQGEALRIVSSLACALSESCQ